MSANTKRLTNSETAAFCGQLALMLRSGLSAEESIRIMQESSDSDGEILILSAIISSLEGGDRLDAALARTDLFPAYMVSMVNIGEETGKLDDVMAALSEHYEREHHLSRSIRSTLTYPLVMSGMMMLVIIVLLVKVLPVFDQVFRQLGTEITGFAAALMNVGKVISTYSMALTIIVAVLVAGLLLTSRTGRGKSMAMAAGRRFRAIRKILENTSACRFAGAMALTLSSGLYPERSLELVIPLCDDPDFRARLDKVTEKMEDGMSLSEALLDQGIFSGMQARLVSIGQRTGDLESAMEHVADLYREEIDDRTNSLLAAIEPTLVIALSIIVGIILLSVMLPLMGIMSTL